jgi:hypothetical protein
MQCEEKKKKDTIKFFSVKTLTPDKAIYIFFFFHINYNITTHMFFELNHVNELWLEVNSINNILNYFCPHTNDFGLYCCAVRRKIKKKRYKEKHG